MANLATTQPTDEAQIRALISDIERAHHAKDVAAIAGAFTSDAVIYDLSPPLAHHGVDVPEKQAWLDTWDGPIEQQSRDLSVTISGDLAVCHGYLSLGGSPKAAGRRIDFWMRATLCLRRGAEGWKVIHEHTSVPFYMDGSLRPAFDLTP